MYRRSFVFGLAALSSLPLFGSRGAVLKKFALCSDSNGTPHYVTTDQTYLAQIAAALGYTPVNYSVSGYTSAQIKACVVQAIADGSNAIMIVAGTNNFSQGQLSPMQTVISTILADVGDAIALVKAAGRLCIVGSPIMPNDITQVHRHLELARQLEFKCAREGVAYIPIAERMLAWFDARALLTDVAPNVYTTEGWHGLASWHAFVAGLVIERQLVSLSEPITLFDLVTTGANGSTAFSDASMFMRAVTAVGSANIQSNAAVFDGTGDALTIADSNDFAIGAQNFSIEVKASVNSTNAVFLIQRQASGDYFIFDINSGKIRCQALSGGAIPFNAQVNWSPSTGTPYAVRVERKSGVVRFFVDGTFIGPATISTYSIPDYAAPLSIGAGDSMPAGYGYNGSISGLKITVG